MYAHSFKPKKKKTKRTEVMPEDIDIITIRSSKTDYPILVTLVPENFNEISKRSGIDVRRLEMKWSEADRKDQRVSFIFWKAAS
mgnify:CR=1 FL=1